MTPSDPAAADDLRPGSTLTGPQPFPEPARRPPLEALVSTVAEELANSLTHGLGLLLALVGVVVLVARTTANGNTSAVVSGVVYGTSLVLLYAASTLYHAIPQPRAKRFFRILDHAFIYLLIAGTYTPFTLITLRGPWGWSLFGTVWSLALLGVAFKIFFTGRFQRLSIALYVAMGWCLLVAIKPLTAGLAPRGMALLVAGGVAYTVGVVFYVAKRLRFGHAVWHAFVLAGSALHYFAILLYVVPTVTVAR